MVVQTTTIQCTVPVTGAIDHVLLEIVAALNDLTASFTFSTAAATTANNNTTAANINNTATTNTATTVSTTVQTHSVFTGLTQQAVAVGLAGSVRLLCSGSQNNVQGASDTEQALVASWMQAAEQTVLPMVRQGTNTSVVDSLSLTVCVAVA
jgi:hypothetical protein